MATTISNTKTQPAVVMDKVHIDSFTLRQDRTPDAKKVIGMSAVLYGTDANGDTVYDKETFGVSDTDIDTTIVAAAMAQGETVETFMAQYAANKVAITDEIANGTLTDEKLMVYFEAALTRILEIHGKISITGIE